MNNLIKINGIKKIGNMEFHDIEGGFGEDKKAMLVKEISVIHGRELREIADNYKKKSRKSHS